MKMPNSTGANRGNGGRKENLCSLCFLLFKSGRDGDADFVFLARDTALAATKSDEGWSPYIDNPDASGLVATNPNCANTKLSMS